MENDSTKIDYAFVDLKSIEIFKEKDTLLFELQVSSLSDTIIYSNKCYYNIYITTGVDDSTTIHLHVSNTNKDSLNKRKSAYRYLTEDCTIKLQKFIYHKNHSISVYPLDSVITSINKNGFMQFKIKPEIISKVEINSYKNNLLVTTRYCNNICHLDYLDSNPVSNLNHKRGIDSSFATN